MFKRIGLLGMHRNPLVAETLADTARLLISEGFEVMIEADSAHSLEIAAKDVSIAPIEQLAEKIDLMIAIGGDGNLLHAARIMSLHDIPVIGINRGQLGFLTDLSPHELHKTLLPILQGAFVPEERFLLEAVVVRENGQLDAEGNALNDIVLFPGDIAQLIEFELRIDGHFVYSQRSDGLIISTPTGSTAYALSAGGPILAPHLNVILLVPKLPHTLTNRPVVISAESEIEIRLSPYNKMASRLSYDGQNHVTLSKQDRVTIRKQSKPLKLLHPKGYDYYAIWRQKLEWGKQLIALGADI